MAIHDGSSSTDHEQVGDTQQQNPLNIDTATRERIILNDEQIEMMNRRFGGLNKTTTTETFDEGQEIMMNQFNSMPTTAVDTDEESAVAQGPVSLGEVLARYQRSEVPFEAKQVEELLAAPGRMFMAARMSVAQTYQRLVG